MGNTAVTPQEVDKSLHMIGDQFRTVRAIRQTSTTPRTDLHSAMQRLEVMVSAAVRLLDEGGTWAEQYTSKG